MRFGPLPRYLRIFLENFGRAQAAGIGLGFPSSFPPPSRFWSSLERRRTAKFVLQETRLVSDWRKFVSRTYGSNYQRARTFPRPEQRVGSPYFKVRKNVHVSRTKIASNRQKKKKKNLRRPEISGLVAVLRQPCVRVFGERTA